MSSSSEQGPRKKRKYSRNGCKECKRRKLKCDESKPRCWNCSHLHKQCTYEKQIKFTNSRSFTIEGDNTKLIDLNTKEKLSKLKERQPEPESQSMQYTQSVQSTQSQVTSEAAFSEMPPMVVQNPPNQSLSNLLAPFDPDPEQELPAPQTPLPAVKEQSETQVEKEFRKQVSYHPLSPKVNPTPQQMTEMNNSLFNGASMLISDLNELIQSFGSDFDFPLNLSFNQLHQQQQQATMLQRELNQNRSSPLQPFEGISPTNYSTHSGDTPVGLEEEISSSHSHYIQKLTNSLKTDFSSGAPKPQPHPHDAFAHAPPHLGAGYGDLAASETTDSRSSSVNKKLSAFPPPSVAILLSDSKERLEYLYTLNNSITQQDLIDLASFFQWSLTSSHINYLKVLITKIHMNILPFTTNFLHNSFIKCFLLEAKSSPHLLFALLAISARYESYQLSQMDQSDASLAKKIKYHNRFRSYYLSSCLKSLDAILHSKPRILNNIESLLLTILILASDYSASMGSQWRAHLRGAKDLLIKYCKFRPITLPLAIIWVWFYAMEILAALTAASGGTIHEFEELVQFLDVIKSTGLVGNTLFQFGFLAPGYYKDEQTLAQNDDPHMDELNLHYSFNLYLGYNDDVVEIFKEIVLTLESCRWFQSNSTSDVTPPAIVKEILNEKGKVRSSRILKMSQLIHKARQFQCMADGPPYRIPIESPYHPLNSKGYHYNNPEGKKIIMSNYVHNTNPQTASPNDHENWYSWQDMSQQLYVDASFLKILTMKNYYGANGLGIDNDLTQDVVDRMLEGISSLVKFKENLTEDDIRELEDYYTKGYEAHRNDQLDHHDIGSEVPEFQYRSRDETEEQSNDIEMPDQKDDVSISSTHSVKEEEDEEEALNEDGDNEDEDSSQVDIKIEEPSMSIPPESHMDSMNRTTANTRRTTINFDRYLYYQFDNRLVMVQWPLYVCGLCCIQPSQKLIVDCCFNALINLGVGSGEISLMKLKNLWNLEKQPNFDYTAYDLLNDENDSVPFV